MRHLDLYAVGVVFVVAALLHGGATRLAGSTSRERNTPKSSAKREPRLSNGTLE
jgi:hypothetical protein